MTDTKVQVEDEVDTSEPSLFVVWIDSNCGHTKDPDWMMNSEPKALPLALAESAKCKADGYPALLLEYGQFPENYVWKSHH